MNELYVLLTTYNGESYVQQQVESILNQTYRDFKLVVRDDGSSDNTLNIIGGLSRQDSRMYILRDTHGNVGAARNFEILIEHALTKGAGYIAFSDQDDIWKPEKLDSLMREISGYQEIPALVHSDLTVTDADLNVVHESFMAYQGIRDMGDQGYRVLPVQNYITGCTVIVNEKLARLALPFPDRLVMHDWWLGLYASYFGKILFIDNKNVLYRQHAKNEIGAKQYSNLVFKSLRVILSRRERDIVFGNLAASYIQARAFYQRVANQSSARGGRDLARLNAYLQAVSGENNRLKSLLLLARSRIRRIDLAGTLMLYAMVLIYARRL